MNSRDLKPGYRFKYPGFDDTFMRIDDTGGRWMHGLARVIAVSLDEGWPLFADDMEVEVWLPA